jgi:hypothetical protein
MKNLTVERDQFTVPVSLIPAMNPGTSSLTGFSMNKVEGGYHEI